MTGAEYDALVLAAALPQTSRHQRSQAARRQSFSSLVDTGTSYGEAPADEARASACPGSGLKRALAEPTPSAVKRRKSSKPAEVVQRQREGKTSSRFHGVSWKDECNEGQGGWKAGYWDGHSIHLGIFSEETAAALAYNKAIEDAGLKGKKNVNPVDANGQPIPKPGY